MNIFPVQKGGVSCLWLELTSAGMLSLGTLSQVKEDVEKKDRSTTSSIYGALGLEEPYLSRAP